MYRIFLGGCMFGFLAILQPKNLSANPYAISPGTFTYLDLPFKNVEATGGSRCSVFFHDAVVMDTLKDVSVDIDSVTVRMLQSKNSYTTLDVYNAYGDVYGWIIAERAVIVVRNQSDLKAWGEFLAQAKAKREAWRKTWFEPVRVLPPKDPSP